MMPFEPKKPDLSLGIHVHAGMGTGYRLPLGLFTLLEIVDDEIACFIYLVFPLTPKNASIHPRSPRSTQRDVNDEGLGGSGNDLDTSSGSTARSTLW